MATDHLTGQTTGDATAGRQTTSPNSLIASDRVEGTPVRRSDGEKLGTIERLMIDKTSGKVAYAEVNLTDDQLREAPRRTGEGRDPSFDRDWEEHVHRYYNATPYWGV
jgi:hypothetical protein